MAAIRAACSSGCTGTLNSACCVSPRAGVTPGLLEDKGCGSTLPEGRRPSSDGVWVPFQCPRRPRCRPALSQQQVRHILRKHGYPPDQQEKATLIVLEQGAVLS